MDWEDRYDGDDDDDDGDDVGGGGVMGAVAKGPGKGVVLTNDYDGVVYKSALLSKKKRTRTRRARGV